MPPHPEFIKSVQAKVAEAAQGGIFVDQWRDVPENVVCVAVMGRLLGLPEGNHDLVPVIEDSLARRSGWRDHFAEGEIHSVVLEMIAEYVKGNPEFVERRLHDLHEQVDAQEKVEIIFPTYNIALEPGQRIALGRLTFVSLHETLHDRLEAAFRASDEDTSLIARDRLKAFPDVAVMYSGKGSQTRVFKNAQQYLEVNRDLLNLIYDRHDRTSWIGAPGNRILLEAFALYGTPEQVSPMRIGASQGKLMLSPESLRNTLVPLTLELSDRDTPLNTLEQAFVNAMRWYANAWSQRDAMTAFLGYANALETLFTPDQHDQKGITHSIAEAMAFISNIDPGRRLDTFEQVKELYRHRSKIVHGKTVNVSTKELETLHTLTFGALRFIATRLNFWSDRKDIDAYVSELRWAGDASRLTAAPQQDGQGFLLDTARRQAHLLRTTLTARGVEISLVYVNASQLSLSSVLALVKEHEAADPMEVVADLLAARPDLAKVDSLDEAVLLNEARVKEGAGVLGLIRVPSARRWVFMESELHVLRAALELSDLPRLEDERGADLGEYEVPEDAMTAAHRARLMHASERGPDWADLEAEMDDEDEEDGARPPVSAVDAHVRWFAEQELHALARASDVSKPLAWPEVLRGNPGLVEALWMDLEDEVEAVLAGQGSHLPRAAQVEIRAAAQVLDEHTLLSCLEEDLASVQGGLLEI